MFMRCLAQPHTETQGSAEMEEIMRQHIRIHKAEPNKGILDYSYLLDAPAGKHGFVEAKNGHLYFEDGERARFLGFNVAARSNTPDHETADKMAERFASMGVNLIREAGAAVKRHRCLIMPGEPAENSTRKD